MDNTQGIPFTYVVTTASLAAGAVGTVTLIMQSDSEFYLCEWLGMSTAETAADVSPNNFTVAIRDQSTGRDLMSAAVPQRLFSGNAYNGNLEATAVKFLPQSNLVFTITNTAGGANTVTVVLKGYKKMIG